MEWLEKKENGFEKPKDFLKGEKIGAIGFFRRCYHGKDGSWAFPPATTTRNHLSKKVRSRELYHFQTGWQQWRPNTEIPRKLLLQGEVL